MARWLRDTVPAAEQHPCNLYIQKKKDITPETLFGRRQCFVSTLTFPLSLALGPCVTLTRIGPLVFSVFYATLFGNTWEVDHNRAVLSLFLKHYCAILFFLPMSLLYCDVIAEESKLKINIFIFNSYCHKFFYYTVTLRYTPCIAQEKKKLHNSKNNSTDEWLCVFSTEIMNEDKRIWDAYRNFYAIFLAVPIVRVRSLILCNKAHCQMCAQ